jgi:hypothetical protein
MVNGYTGAAADSGSGTDGHPRACADCDAGTNAHSRTNSYGGA